LITFRILDIPDSNSESEFDNAAPVVLGQSSQPLQTTQAGPDREENRPNSPASTIIEGENDSSSEPEDEVDEEEDMVVDNFRTDNGAVEGR
jgi:hypothetical protein